jgi:hypothetical protein
MRHRATVVDLSEKESERRKKREASHMRPILCVGPTYQMVHFMIAGGAQLEIVIWTGSLRDSLMYGDSGLSLCNCYTTFLW